MTTTIESGKFWAHSTPSTDLIAGAKINIGLITTDRAVKFDSLFLEAEGKDIRIDIIEALEFTGGTQLLLKNRNRVGDFTPSFTYFSGVTPEEDLTDTEDSRILTMIEFRASNQTTISQKIDSERFRVLFKPYTKYILRVWNADTSAATFSAQTTFEEKIWSA